MKYIKKYQRINESMSDIYGYYSIANIHNVEDILNILKENEIYHKYDAYSNFIDIEFCGAFVGDDVNRKILEEIISNNRCNEVGVCEDDCLCIRPMKFY